MERVLAGVSADTFKSLQLGPGAIIRNFKYEEVKTPQEFKDAFLDAIRNGQSLGGTQGGINVNVTPTYRKIEIDGANVPFKGDKVIDEWTCYMEATLKEFTPRIMEAAFPTSEFAEIGTAVAPATETGIVAQRIRTAVGDNDYNTNDCWIATTQYGYIMVAMFNTLGGTTGAITAADRAEGNIPFRVDGHIEDFEDIDYAPCELWYVSMVDGIIKVPVGA